jgi:ketosteroid isomerase-like protein
MQADVELVRQIVGALSRGDLDGMLARMDPEFEWMPLEASPIARAYRGHEQVRHYVEDWLSTFESVRLELEDPEQVGERVVAVVNGRARGRGSGLEIENRFCQVWTVRGGMAVAMEEHASREHALAALGST